MPRRGDPYRDENGVLWAPARAGGPGGVIGDGYQRVEPGDADYELVAAEVTELELEESRRVGGPSLIDG